MHLEEVLKTYVSHRKLQLSSNAFIVLEACDTDDVTAQIFKPFGASTHMGDRTQVCSLTPALCEAAFQTRAQTSCLARASKHCNFTDSLLKEQPGREFMSDLVILFISSSIYITPLFHSLSQWRCQIYIRKHLKNGIKEQTHTCTTWMFRHMGQGQWYLMNISCFFVWLGNKVVVIPAF